MSDLMNDDFEDEEGPSFADLLDEYTADRKDNPKVGDKIRGKIISIGKETVFVDTGSKIDGTVDRKELLAEDGSLPYEQGDFLDLYVTAVEENDITLSKAVSGIGGAAMLEEAYHNSIPVEGKVTGIVKGGFNVEILKRRAFCPVSQIDVRYVENQEEFIGQTYTFQILQYENKGKNIVVSRRRLLEIEQEKQREEFLKTLAEGSVMEGKITRIMPYGVFVELLPGLEGMAHISELSWSKIQKPEEVLTRGEKVSVVVLEIKEREKGQKAPKISLSLKQLTIDPWDTAEEKFQPGMKITGRVTRCMAFGAFVEIEPGIEGLVHISEMSHTRRVLKAEDVVTPGETISVAIKDIDLKNRRISLSIKEMEGDPWEAVKDMFKVGKPASGTVEQKVDFGLFIQLVPGVVGLMPKSNMNKASDLQALQKLKPGDPITVMIEAIDTAERKITLSPGDAQTETEWKEYAQPVTEQVGQGGFGSLAEKLQSALNKKNDK